MADAKPPAHLAERQAVRRRGPKGAGSVWRLEQRLLADNIAHGHMPSRDRSSRVIYRDISYEEREGESSSAHKGSPLRQSWWISGGTKAVPAMAASTQEAG